MIVNLSKLQLNTINTIVNGNILYELNRNSNLYRIVNDAENLLPNSFPVTVEAVIDLGYKVTFTESKIKTYYGYKDLINFLENKGYIICRRSQS